MNEQETKYRKIRSDYLESEDGRVNVAKMLELGVKQVEIARVTGLSQNAVSNFFVHRRAVEEKKWRTKQRPVRTYMKFWCDYLGQDFEETANCFSDQVRDYLLGITVQYGAYEVTQNEETKNDNLEKENEENFYIRTLASLAQIENNTDRNKRDFSLEWSLIDAFSEAYGIRQTDANRPKRLDDFVKSLKRIFTAVDVLCQILDAIENQNRDNNANHDLTYKKLEEIQNDIKRVKRSGMK